MATIVDSSNKFVSQVEAPQLKLTTSYTVATLPAVVEGQTVYVTDGYSPLYVGKAGAWEPVTDNSIAKRISIEALVIPIDYVSGIAWPTDVIFYKQADINSYLTGLGATGFKYLMDAWAGTPNIILHSFVFDLAAGIHRPRSSDTTIAFSMTGKTAFGSGTVTLRGSPNYTVIQSIQTITAHQVASDDPWVECAGTPFVSGALKGYLLVLDNGQVQMIHDNTTNRIYVNSNLSPTPTNGVTTFTVCKPSTVIRNSEDDIATKTGTSVSINLQNITTTNVLVMNDIMFDPFGGSSISVAINTTRSSINRCIIDQLTLEGFGKTPNGNCWSFGSSGSVTLNTSSVISNPSNPSTSLDAPIFATSSTAACFINLTRCFFQGGVGSFISGTGTTINLNCSVFDTSGRGSTPAISVSQRASFGGQDQTGKRSEIRNTPVASGCCLYYDDGSVLLYGNNSISIHLTFKDNGSDCLWFGSSSTGDWATVTTVGGWRDGGGNLGYGIVMKGAGALVNLNVTTDVTGSLGNVKMFDGTILTYAQLLTNVTTIDDAYNIVRKVA